MRRKWKAAALVAAMALSLAFRRDPAAVSAAPVVLHPVRMPSHDPWWDWRMHPELWRVLDQEGDPLFEIGVIGEPPRMSPPPESVLGVACVQGTVRVTDPWADPRWLPYCSTQYVERVCGPDHYIWTDLGYVFGWTEADEPRDGAPTYEQIWLPSYGDVCNPIRPYCSEWGVEYFPQYLLDWKELWNAPEQPGLVR